LESEDSEAKRSEKMLRVYEGMRILGHNVPYILKRKLSFPGLTNAQICCFLHYVKS